MIRSAIAVFLLVGAPAGARAAERVLRFSGMDWVVKDVEERGPGPNAWSDSERNVWLDDEGRLHLRITYDARERRWECAEVYSRQTIGPGAYHFLLKGRPQEMDKNVVLGLFLYESDSLEADFEVSAWGGETAKGQASFSVQPAERPSFNTIQFDLAVRGDESTNSIEWTPSTIRFRSLEGHAVLEQHGRVVREWEHRAPALQSPRLHMNLWLLKGAPPSDGREVEMVIAGVVRTQTLPRLERVKAPRTKLLDVDPAAAFSRD